VVTKALQITPDIQFSDPGTIKVIDWKFLSSRKPLPNSPSIGQTAARIAQCQPARFRILGGFFGEWPHQFNEQGFQFLGQSWVHCNRQDSASGFFHYSLLWNFCCLLTAASFEQCYKRAVQSATIPPDQRLITNTAPCECVSRKSGVMHQ